MALYYDVLADSVAIYDWLTPSGTQRVSIADSFSTAEAAITGLLLYDTQADSVGLTDAVLRSWDLAILDTLSLLEALRDHNSIVRIADSIALQDTSLSAWGLNISESLAIADSLSIVLEIILNELLSLQASVATIAAQRLVADDVISLLDISSLVKVFLDTIAESVGCNDTLAVLVGKLLFILDNLTLADLLIPSTSFYTTQLDSVNFVDINSGYSDILRNVYGALEFALSESIGMTDNAMQSLVMLCLLSSPITVSDNTWYQYSLTITLDESINTLDNVSTTTKLYNLLQDSLGFTIDITLNGVVYQCWVMTGESLLPSIYSNYGFNSFIELNGRCFGSDETGIWELTGSTDAGVNFSTGLITTTVGESTENVKRFRSGFFGLSANGAVTLKVETEQGAPEYYEVKNRYAAIGKNVSGKTWTFSLENADEVKFVEMIPVVLTRRHI